ncbi:response regulator [Desulfovibrio sp. DV]|uniref:HD domain-containing phosphohydrolase n=1 Tax=Desulfovibrio sp. DV TaxID=1844708 RepID=UPI00094BB130|nr:HD domain-containing phosphohydrolase [Desulfovibrio sp. DV]OLN26732.1 response regulator [Desulfovibrio sp. DV]
MVPLRRLLKKRALAPLLARAQAMLGPGWQTDVVDAAQSAPAPGCRQEPLRLDGMLIGYLVLTPPDDADPAAIPAPDLGQKARFVADCLEAIIDGEALRRTLAGETLTKYREISLLHRATLGLNGSLRPKDVAQALLDECRRGELPAEVGMVFLRAPGETAFAPVCAYGDTAACTLDRVAASGLFHDICTSQKGEIVNDLAADSRWAGEAPLSSLLLSPLVSTSRCVGMLVLGGPTPMLFEASHLQYIGTLATVAGIATGNALHFDAIQALINSLMQALATAIDARDPFTAGHSQRVARLGVALARTVHFDTSAFAEVAFTPHDLEELLYAGLLHDVGKIGIREEVLTKATRLSAGVMEVIGQRLALHGLTTGQDMQADFQALCRINAADVVTADDAALVARIGAREIRFGETVMPLLGPREIACLLIARGNLTPEERLEIERHPAESHRILQHIPFPQNMQRLLPIISQHHERLDGSGYPGRLREAEILLQSRIIAIVDIYDAITMARHYKPALPREKALGVLWQEARAGRIDARLVRLFDDNIDTVERDCARLERRLDLSEFLLTPTPA